MKSIVCICFLTSLVLPLGDISAQDSTKVDSVKYDRTREFLQRLIQDSKKEAMDELTKAPEKDSQDSLKSGMDGLEIDGLILNETKTKIGQDFYEFFYNAWDAPEDVFNYSLSIWERPAGRMGSWVWVNVNETTVYQYRLSPRPDEIEQAAINASSIVMTFLMSRDQDQQQLAGDEMAGTGIF